MADLYGIFEKVIRGSELSKVTYQVEGAVHTDPEEVPLPLIIYRLDNRVPAHGWPKPRTRGFFQDERVPDKVVSIEFQEFDAVIVFTCIGRTVTETWQVADKLEDVLLQNAGVIKSQGFNDIRFRSAKSSVFGIGSQDFFSVDLTYWVKYHRVYQTYVGTIGDVEVQGEIVIP